MVDSFGFKTMQYMVQGHFVGTGFGAAQNDAILVDEVVSVLLGWSIVMEPDAGVNDMQTTIGQVRELEIPLEVVQHCTYVSKGDA